MPDARPAASPGAAPRGHAPRWFDARARALPLWIGIAVLVVLLDQASKYAILARFDEGEQLPVIPGWFNLTLWYNPGAAFSFLAGHDGWQRWFFTGIALVASVFILTLLVRHWYQGLFCGALALILGGALGNLVDRLEHGKVVDFLLFYRGGWSFPAFNLADSAITLGAALLILDELLRMRRSRREARADDPSTTNQGANQ
ncbi:MAG: signal peptidase II [Lautropia sp.]